MCCRGVSTFSDALRPLLENNRVPWAPSSLYVHQQQLCNGNTCALHCVYACSQWCRLWPGVGQRLVDGPISNLTDASSSVNTWPAGVTTRNWNLSETPKQLCWRHCASVSSAIQSVVRTAQCAQVNPQLDYLPISKILQNRYGFVRQKSPQ